MRRILHCLFIGTILLGCSGRGANDSSSGKLYGVVADGDGWVAVTYVNGNPVSVSAANNTADLTRWIGDGTNIIRIIASRDSSCQMSGLFQIYEADPLGSSYQEIHMFEFPLNDKLKFDESYSFIVKANWDFFSNSRLEAERLVGTLNEHDRQCMYDELLQVAYLLRTRKDIGKKYFMPFPENEKNLDELRKDMVNRIYRYDKLRADVIEYGELVFIQGIEMVLVTSKAMIGGEMCPAPVLHVGPDRELETGDISLNHAFVLFVNTSCGWRLLF